jgi:hypothetical protein
METNNDFIKKIVLFGMIPFLFVLTEIIYSRYAMTDLIHVCGKFIGEGAMKGSRMYNMKVVYENKTYYFSVYRSFIKKDIDLDSLLKIECVDLQMSTIDHDYFDLVDKRVLRQ